MSLATWKKEFYPVEAITVPAAEAVAHSLKKWRGLTEENLKRHGLIKSEGCIEDDVSALTIACTSCALCAHYFDDRVPAQEDDPAYCPDCPLSQARGNAACDTRRDGEDIAPYAAWCYNADPAPMIAALEAAAKYEDEHAKGATDEPRNLEE